jgi:hypothetical protein
MLGLLDRSALLEESIPLADAVGAAACGRLEV